MTLKTKVSNETFELKRGNESATLSGYASTFGNKDFTGDIVVKGAFAQTIREWKKKNKPLPLLYQHDSRMPIGKLTAMKEDDRGLYIEGTILETVDKGREVISLIEAGVLDSMSIGYMAKDFDYDLPKNVRNLKTIDLREVSVVTFPANDQATISGIKGELPKTIREFEDFLRDAGYSREQSKAIASAGFKGMDSERDAGVDAEVIKQLENFTNTLRR